jgi:hypothetical protein
MNIKATVLISALTLLVSMGAGCQVDENVPKTPTPAPVVRCAVENCHGMDITCGPNPPEACTAMYGIGDKCLQYAKCGMQDGKCQQVADPQFTKCKTCVQTCIDANKNDNMKMFDCESRCN